MQPIKFEEILQKIVELNPRYHRDAFLFVREALEHTQSKLGKPKRDEVRHVSGKELMEGIRSYAIEQYGPMVPTLFSEWGILSCEDFGEIVFIMIEHNILAKSDKDTREDFKGAFTFFEVFQKPYLPASKRAAAPKSVKV